MSIFHTHRTELILAAAIALGGAGFFFIARSGSPPVQKQSPQSAQTAQTLEFDPAELPVETGFEVRSVKARRDGANIHLILRTAVKGPDYSPVVLDDSRAQLIAGQHRPVPRFTGAFLPEQISIPGSGGVAELHFWLAAAELQEALELEISGRRQLVKAALPFSPDELPEGRTVALQFPKWRKAE